MVFLVALYFVKNGALLNQNLIFSGSGNGLAYNNIAIEDLVTKDTDGDSVLDWEESLWGLDPSRAETTPGTPDSVVVNKMRTENFSGSASGDKTAGATNLTKTEQFSRELFSTVASLNQSGVLDDATVEQLSTSLVSQIQESSMVHLLTLSDLKTTTDNSLKSYVAYNTALSAIYNKYNTKYTVYDVLAKFIADGEEVDPSALKDLEPIIISTKGMANSMSTVTVPEEVALIHVSVINALSLLAQNLSDIKLYESDPLLALRGISQYEKNSEILSIEVNKLATAINTKLKN